MKWFRKHVYDGSPGDRFHYILTAYILGLSFFVSVMVNGCAAFQPGDISTAQKCIDIVGSYQRGIENAVDDSDAERITAEVADFFKTWNAQGCQDLVERVAEEADNVAKDTP